jgi:hypothetical protein
VFLSILKAVGCILVKFINNLQNIPSFFKYSRILICYREISRHPRSENSSNTWMDSIRDGDREGVEAVWKTLVDKKIAVTHEFRFKTPWQGRNGSRGDTWVLMSAYPEKDQTGQLKSVFGSITNISQQKWAEDFQKRRMEEAIELKRQQENFIDMTS